MRHVAASLLIVTCISSLSLAQPAPERSAQWERKASEWALEEIQRVRDANPDKVKLLDLANAPPPPPPADLTPEQQNAGALLFARPVHTPISRREALTGKESAALSLTAARNESESAQLGVYALADLKNLQVQVSPLVHTDDKSRLAEQNIRTFFVSPLIVPVMQKKGAAPADDDLIPGAGPKVTGFKEVPAALLDLPSVDLSKGYSQGIWIDVHIPADALPGRYSGEVTLSAGGNSIGKAPLTVEVRPFELEWVKKWGRGAFISPYLDRQQLIQGKEHGLNQVSWWNTGGNTIKLNNGRIEADFAAVRTYLKLLDDVGYDGPHAHFIGGSNPKLANNIAKLLKRPMIEKAREGDASKAYQAFDFSKPFPELLVQTVKQFHEQAKAAGHPDLSICLMDEPDHDPKPARPQFYAKMFAIVEKGAPEVPLYGTFYHEGDEDRLSHHHAVWTTNRPAKKIADMCRRAGKQFFTYGGGYSYSGSPQDARFRFGALPWVYQADGSFFWGLYQHNGSPFNPFEITNTATPALPTPHGPLATPMFKGIREAVDDYRYLATLQSLIARANADGPEAARKQAAEHQGWLDSFRLPLYEKMAVRAGRPTFDAVSKFTVTATDGSTMSLENLKANTWAFCEFIREDASRRIESLSKAMQPE